jgi:endonuclease/exonuclease/phosphatase family metal-dependent hydrolase
VTHFVVEDRALVVGNIHGVALPGHKLDTEMRLYQSKTILEYFAKIDSVKIIGGDFNLMPETRSIGMFDEVGYQNLIREYAIDTTRNEISWVQYPTKQFYADFFFVSSETEVKGFEVPKNEASDHLPMILEVAI